VIASSAQVSKPINRLIARPSGPDQDRLPEVQRGSPIGSRFNRN